MYIYIELEPTEERSTGCTDSPQDDRGRNTSIYVSIHTCITPTRPRPVPVEGVTKVGVEWVPETSGPSSVREPRVETRTGPPKPVSGLVDQGVPPRETDLGRRVYCSRVCSEAKGVIGSGRRLTSVLRSLSTGSLVVTLLYRRPGGGRGQGGIRRSRADRSGTPHRSGGVRSGRLPLTLRTPVGPGPSV